MGRDFTKVSEKRKLFVTISKSAFHYVQRKRTGKSVSVFYLNYYLELTSCEECLYQTE